MSNFIYNSYCVEHPGVVHVYQAADDRKSAVKRFSGKRGASALLLAALVAALMVVVNEVAHNWTDGHMLGACGAFEAWMSIEMMRAGWFAPTLNLAEVDPRCGQLDFITGQGRELQAEYVMSNNFAFGGINTSLVFRRWRE